MQTVKPPKVFDDAQALPMMHDISCCKDWVGIALSLGVRISFGQDSESLTRTLKLAFVLVCGFTPSHMNVSTQSGVTRAHKFWKTKETRVCCKCFIDFQKSLGLQDAPARQHVATLVPHFLFDSDDFDLPNRFRSSQSISRWLWDHQDRLRDHLRSGAGVGVGMMLKGYHNVSWKSQRLNKNNRKGHELADSNIN